MILKRRKLIGALLVILEDRRGPPFFLDIIKKKSKGIYPFVLIYFPMLILHVRTLEIECRTRVISQNACIFMF